MKWPLYIHKTVKLYVSILSIFLQIFILFIWKIKQISEYYHKIVEFWLHDKYLISKIWDVFIVEKQGK